ncbi:LytR/AlgR family response regulator transcription factor [Mangrovivirga cuniculi]|uniref:DNA-binding response regulator n=1 Tax=Mangrovivirga cuniculi TaxID=2715131 RepID=A0A4D7JFC1_9BACT|nr:LytTR family DNA-binding domain-containing protein [Mangrovivirga cuniculi]QCK13823.1 hypothetical protein DCC35_03130 [Mangrovivirga cuniculi]
MIVKVIIADDEPNARDYLNRLLKEESDVKVIGECRNGAEVIDMIKNENDPVILFLDIQMPGINGIDVARKIEKKNIYIIFTTAYDEYAIDAFEVNAYDYLLKPFDDSRLRKALNKAFSRIQNDLQAELSNKLLNVYDEFKKNQSDLLTEIIIKEKGLERRINVEDILYFESESVYVRIITKDKSDLYRTPMNNLENNLPAFFIRIHRAYIINLNKVSEYKYMNNNCFQFKMNNGVCITSSRSYKSLIQDNL